MITIDANPQAYRKAGLLMLDACVLALLVRAGLSGLTVGALADGLRSPAGTARNACFRLVAMGLVVSPQRQGKQGRPNLFHASPAGISLQGKAMMAVDYTAARQMPLEIQDGKNQETREEDAR